MKPELGRLRLALVNQGLLDIVGRVELGGLLGGLSFGRLRIMAGENAAVFGLDCPETTLVVHLRSGVFAYALNQFWVAVHMGLPLLRCHLLLLPLAETLQLPESLCVCNDKDIRHAEGAETLV